MLTKLVLGLTAFFTVSAAGPVALRPSTHVVVYNPHPYNPFVNTSALHTTTAAANTTGLDSFSGRSMSDDTTGVQFYDRDSSSTTGEQVHPVCAHSVRYNKSFSLRGSLKNTPQ